MEASSWLTRESKKAPKIADIENVNLVGARVLAF